MYSLIFSEFSCVVYLVCGVVIGILNISCGWLKFFVGVVFWFCVLNLNFVWVWFVNGDGWVCFSGVFFDIWVVGFWYGFCCRVLNFVIFVVFIECFFCIWFIINYNGVVIIVNLEK